MSPSWVAEDAHFRLAGDAEQVLRICILQINARAEKVVVEMLHLLVTGEEHQPAAPASDLQVVFQVFMPALARHIQGNDDTFSHFLLPKSLSQNSSKPLGENLQLNLRHKHQEVLLLAESCPLMQGGGCAGSDCINQALLQILALHQNR